MIKKQQKWIALFVAVTFIWLLQVSTMPAGRGRHDREGQFGQQRAGAGLLSRPLAGKYVPAQKKSILPYVLIGVGVVAVAALSCSWWS